MDVAGVYYRGVRSRSSGDEGSKVNGEKAGLTPPPPSSNVTVALPIKSANASSMAPVFAHAAVKKVAQVVTVTEATHTVFAAQPIATMIASEGMRIEEEAEPSASFSGLFFR